MVECTVTAIGTKSWLGIFCSGYVRSNCKYRFAFYRLMVNISSILQHFVSCLQEDLQYLGIFRNRRANDIGSWKKSATKSNGLFVAALAVPIFLSNQTSPQGPSALMRSEKKCDKSATIHFEVCLIYLLENKLAILHTRRESGFLSLPATRKASCFSRIVFGIILI